MSSNDPGTPAELPADLPTVSADAALTTLLTPLTPQVRQPMPKQLPSECAVPVDLQVASRALAARNVHWFAFGGLVMLLIDFVGSAIVRYGRSSELFAMIVGAWLAGQFVLAGLGLAMGRWPLLVRLGCVIALALGLAMPHDSRVASEFGSFFVIWISVIALPFAIARLIGFRIVPVNGQGESIDPETHRRQFSLMQIFSLMTAVGIVAGIARSGLLAFPRDIGAEAGLFFLLALIPALLALLAAFCVLGQSGRIFGWSLGLLGLANMAILLFGAGMGGARAFAEVFEMLFAVHFGMVVALLPIRMLGYRIAFGRRATAAPARMAGESEAGAAEIDDIPD